MDVRCYASSKKRTKYKKLRFAPRDIVAVVFAAVMIAGVILLNIYGYRICPQIYPYVVI